MIMIDGSTREMAEMNWLGVSSLLFTCVLFLRNVIKNYDFLTMQVVSSVAN